MMKKKLCVLLAAVMLSGCAARSLPEIENPPADEPESSLAREQAPEEITPGEPTGSEPESMEPESMEPEGGEPTDSAPESSGAAGSEAPADDGTADWMLLLANSTHAIGDYQPELAEVQNGYKMDTRVAGAAKQMIADAQTQGVSLLVCSAYRPYSSQKRNFDASVAANIAAGMSKEKALAATKSLIAEPGKSEHQTGLAADIVTPAYQNLDDGYGETAAAKWLLKNAADYGFILRYPADKSDITGIHFEPWHYRFVGVDAAKTIMEQKLCLEEYLASGVA